MRHGLTFLALITASALAACSGDDNANPVPANDAGSSDTGSGQDASQGSDAGDAGAPGHDGGDAAATASDAGDAGDAAPPGDDGGTDGGTDASDAGAAPIGTPIVAGAVTLEGITSDGYVIYMQGTALMAAPIAGGTPQEISQNPNPTNVLVRADGSSPGVLINVPASLSAPSLYVWTAAHGYHGIATLANAYSFSNAVSPDGQYVAFTTSDIHSTPTSVGVAKTDGTGTTVLQSLGTVGCSSPMVSFGSNGTLIATYCGGFADGGATQLTTAAYAAGTFARTMSTTAEATVPPLTDAAGAWLWWDTLAGGELLDTSTGAVVLTVPNGVSAAFDASGQHLFYTNATSLFEIATAAPSAPTTLIPTDCDGPLALSPDGTVILCYVAGAPGVDAGATGIEAATTGTSTTTWSVWQGGAGATFTADSREIVLSDANALYVEPAKGGSATELAETGNPFMVAGSKFLTLGGPLTVFDASGAAAPVTLAGSVTGVRVTADLGTIVYAVSGAWAGLYVTPVP